MCVCGGGGTSPDSTRMAFERLLPTAALACDRARLERTPLATVIGLLRGAAFRHNVDQLEGYDPHDCGKLLDLDTGLGPTAL